MRERITPVETNLEKNLEIRRQTAAARLASLALPSRIGGLRV